MTLRGYSAVLDEDQGSSQSSMPSQQGSTTKAQRPESAPPTERSEKPTRPLWPIGDGLGLRPSSVAARQALSAVTNAASNIDQHLALIEMLIAVGPEVRERDALDESLRALEKLEDHLSGSVSRLLRSCAEIRGDGSSH